MNTSTRSGPLLAITGTIFILLGLALLGGGLYLASLGGSLYYVAAGIGLIVAGWLVCKARRAALGVMALILIVTLVWSLIEVRFDWWQLLPRLDRRLGKDDGKEGKDLGRKALAGAAVLTVIAGVIALFQDYLTSTAKSPRTT